MGSAEIGNIYSSWYIMIGPGNEEAESQRQSWRVLNCTALMYTTTSSYKQMFKEKKGEGGWKLYLDHIALTLGRKTKKGRMWNQFSSSSNWNSIKWFCHQHEMRKLSNNLYNKLDNCSCMDKWYFFSNNWINIVTRGRLYGNSHFSELQAPGLLLLFVSKARH